MKRALIADFRFVFMVRRESWTEVPAILKRSRERRRTPLREGSRSRSWRRRGARSWRSGREKVARPVTVWMFPAHRRLILTLVIIGISILAMSPVRSSAASSKGPIITIEFGLIVRPAKVVTRKRYTRQQQVLLPGW